MEDRHYARRSGSCPSVARTAPTRAKKARNQEGKNLHVDWRNLPDENAARLIAQEFVRNRVDLIVTYENQTVRAAKAATSEIPIVFIAVTDPVAEGFVTNFARPGGNIIGFATWGDLYSKELELFKEIAMATQTAGSGRSA
jgi:putative tryptophan/tyrosine transport system substrate-binding protein